jgi:hypothetical protein
MGCLITTTIKEKTMSETLFARSTLLGLRRIAEEYSQKVRAVEAAIAAVEGAFSSSAEEVEETAEAVESPPLPVAFRKDAVQEMINSALAGAPKRRKKTTKKKKKRKKATKKQSVVAERPLPTRQLKATGWTGKLHESISLSPKEQDFVDALVERSPVFTTPQFLVRKGIVPAPNHVTAKVSQLRKKGVPIESARQARETDENVPELARGYRLIS